MGRHKTRLPDIRIDPLRRKIDYWRRTRVRRSPMPEPLWQGAVGLAREHGVYATAQALRLSYGSLRTRTEAAGLSLPKADKCARARTTFVELAVAPSAVVPTLGGAVVEVTGPGGQRLTVRLRDGELDVAELIRACWSGRA